MSSNTAFIILGNQLFPFAHLKPHRHARFFMAEDLGLCTYVRHHKQKIALFLAAMRSYRDELRDQDCTVHYERLDTQSGAEKRTKYETKLERWLDGLSDPPHRLVMWEIEDKFFEQRIVDFAERRGVAIEFLESPMFLTPRSEFAAYLDDADHKPFMAGFYKRQRRRLGVLMNKDDSPRGGKWSYDDQNRESLPKKIDIPATTAAGVTDHVRAVVPFINDTFSDHPGVLDESSWMWPATRRQALAWYRRFLDERFTKFGPYEDAMTTRDPFLWHSALTPALNLGLVTPREVLDRALAHAKEHDVPLNSLEGFVRQIIGWREFIRGVYRNFSEEQDEANFFNCTNKLTEHWWDGTTGVVPLDDTIRHAQQRGWTHHIERLMVAGNLMLLCEIEPREAHRWFMEMFIDSSDWVMGPNVYGMGIFSDGGIFSTKPYICGSNYILRMSDYSKPKEPTIFDDDDLDDTWCDVMDGLYWRFIDRHVDYFKSNARLAAMTGTLNRMKAERKKKIFSAAERFLERVTT